MHGIKYQKFIAGNFSVKKLRPYVRLMYRAVYNISFQFSYNYNIVIILKSLFISKIGVFRPLS